MDDYTPFPVMPKEGSRGVHILVEHHEEKAYYNTSIVPLFSLRNTKGPGLKPDLSCTQGYHRG